MTITYRENPRCHYVFKSTDEKSWDLLGEIWELLDQLSGKYGLEYGPDDHEWTDSNHRKVIDLQYHSGDGTVIVVNCDPTHYQRSSSLIKELIEELGGQKVVNCPGCGAEVSQALEQFKMTGSPDRNGRRICLEMGVFECPKCRKRFREVLRKLRIDGTGAVVKDGLQVISTGEGFSIKGCWILWLKRANVSENHRQAIKKSLVEMSYAISEAMKFTIECTRMWDHPRELEVKMGLNDNLFLPMHRPYYIVLQFDEPSITDIAGQVAFDYPLWECRIHGKTGLVGVVVTEWPPIIPKTLQYEWELYSREASGKPDDYEAEAVRVD